MGKKYIRLYTGDGNGQNAAALGLALRAARARKKVIMLQFMKNPDYSALLEPSRVSRFELEQYGSDVDITHEFNTDDILRAYKGLERFRTVVCSGDYDMVIADEINFALHQNLFPFSDLRDILKNRAPFTEIIFTGSYAPQELIRAADLVSDMREIMHYCTRGIEPPFGFRYLTEVVADG